MELAEKLVSGETRSLSRAISLVENRTQDASQLLEIIRKTNSQATVVGITGPPGVGKSTLISAYISHLRHEGMRVAVVSVDPSSPLTGGAILGDRLRMHCHVSDSGVFIRSVAARGHLGGLSRNIKDVVNVIRASGDGGNAWDYILLETVGTGQSEVEVVDIADVCVVVSCPGMGDDIQAMKAGILDIADILVVNKADLPDASRTTRSLRGMLKLRVESRQSVPVIELVATQGQGIAELAREIEKHRKEPA